MIVTRGRDFWKNRRSNDGEKVESSKGNANVRNEPETIIEAPKADISKREDFEDILWPIFLKAFPRLRDRESDEFQCRVATFVMHESYNILAPRVQKTEDKLKEAEDSINRLESWYNGEIATVRSAANEYWTGKLDHLSRTNQTQFADAKRDYDNRVEALHQRQLNELQQLQRELQEHKQVNSQRVHEIADKDKQHRAEISEKDRRHKADMDKKDKQHKNETDKKDRRIADHDRLRKAELDKQTQEHKADINQRAQAQENVLKQWRQTFQDLNGQIEQTKSTHSRAIEDLKQRHATDLHNQTQVHDEALTSLHQELKATKEKTEEDRERMIVEHSQIIESVQQTHAEDMSQLAQVLETTKTQSNDQMKKITTEHEKAMEERNRAHEEETSQLIQANKSREEELAIKYEKRTRRLRYENQELNEALLARDDEKYLDELFTPDIPGKADEKIRDQFVEIVQMVEDLGRLNWKGFQENWTDTLLQRGSTQDGQRLLKKAIIQDIIWTLLFQFVFCSPFRVFGEEGKALEEHWNDECGKDEPSSDDIYTWPVPGIKAERWRYFTVKECREVLTQPIPSQWDQRARVKRGFKSSLDGLIEELRAELGDIVNLTASDIQLMERLAKKVAITWLEFAMYRCRIIVRLNGTKLKSTAEKTALAQKSSLVLTVVPTVGRYGDVKGAELERFTTIEGCSGDTSTIPKN